MLYILLEENLCALLIYIQEAISLDFLSANAMGLSISAALVRCDKNQNDPVCPNSLVEKVESSPCFMTSRNTTLVLWSQRMKTSFLVSLPIWIWLQFHSVGWWRHQTLQQSKKKHSSVVYFYIFKNPCSIVRPFFSLMVPGCVPVPSGDCPNHHFLKPYAIPS